MIERNAKIAVTKLGFDDSGVFTFILFLDYGDSSCGWGGWSLGNQRSWDLIKEILRVVGVDCWEGLEGKPVRARQGEDTRILAIGNLYKDEWIYLDKFFTKE